MRDEQDRAETFFEMAKHKTDELVDVLLSRIENEAFAGKLSMKWPDDVPATCLTMKAMRELGFQVMHPDMFRLWITISWAPVAEVKPLPYPRPWWKFLA